MDRTSLGERFAGLWKRETSAPDVFQFVAERPELTPEQKAELCEIDQLHRWPAGLGIPVERYLEKVPDLFSDIQLKLRLVVVEFRSRQEMGGSPELDSFFRRFPDLRDPLRKALAPPPGDGSPPAEVVPTESMSPTDVPGHGSATQNNSQDQDFGVEPGAFLSLPTQIGRYRVLRILGDGGFGRVYLAYDDVLLRQVAIKVPHAYRISGPADVEAYLKEARVVASLDDHTIAIVPVYDCGQTEDGLCYVVSKYIEGSDLATKIKRTPLTSSAAAEVVAKVAEALHAAHLRGVVHRDVKPANILIDLNDRPFLADFGIALKEEDYGTGEKTIGTIPYMSPEQLRGEGHLVDGRSDIFSLGVALYEVICGRRPFPANRLAQAASIEPKPPRQINDAIPKELERICLKALSNRVSDRYSTALDMAVDLRDLLKVGSGSDGPPAVVAVSSGSGVVATSGQLAAAREIPIVFKGLRSFDRDDAGFFLELLPGPRDKEGLPESIRFWKTRIQETDPDQTFRVGLLYGPSGCGKSSLLKAGVIPRLGDGVIPIYIESTPLDTEVRLLKALRKECPDLPHDLDLPETAKALRRGQGGRKKVLVVLDQFEQWLHARHAIEKSPLVRALRQSDGQHLQCVVSVRDDFWMAVTHLMNELEVALVPGDNVAAVDLFSLRHAKKVLTAIGHAHHALPPVGDDISAEQKKFINQAVGDLARDDRVIPVHLALFAQMVKDRPWVLATLKELGGTEGVGVTFLEETFNGPTANPSHRLHQKAARLVLGALLSEQGGNIKGAMRSYEELLAVSGYEQQPREFVSLLRILDSELRLITPTDPEGLEMSAAGASGSALHQSERYYHLTHDYLVPSLREWLTRKQKETRRGRAELLLAERAAAWNAKPTNRHLPSLWEHLNIRLLTTPKKWTSPQRKMMVKGGRLHAGRVGIAATILIALTFSGLVISRQIEEKRQADKAAALVQQLTVADPVEVPRIVRELDEYRRWADPLLREEDKAGLGLKKKINLALGLLPVDQSKVAELRGDLLLVSPSQFSVVLDALLPFKSDVTEPLWSVALDTKENAQPRFQAACALAVLATHDQRWATINTAVANHLVALEASALVAWREKLRPGGDHLLKPLSAIFRDTNRSESSRIYATETLAEFASEQPDQLFDLLADAELFQFPLLFEKLTARRDKAVALATMEVAKKFSPGANEDEKERLAKRQANAAVALLRLGSAEPVWPLLKARKDPRVRSYIIHWLSPRAVEPTEIIQRLEIEPDVTIRSALVLALGQFTDAQLPAAQRQPLISKFLAVYENEADPGLHGSSEWLLRNWAQQKQLDAILTKLKCDKEQLRARPNGRWYVNSQKQTFVIVEGGEFLMGSPASEPGYGPQDAQLRICIGRTFAISAHEVTKAQYRTFQQAVKGFDLSNHPVFRHYVRTDDSAQIGVNWYDAAHYCDWLSEQEKIPRDQWCYDPKGGVYGPGMKAKDKFWELKGYRLPTQAEWEFACRAETVTSRYYGASDQLLTHYARFAANSQDHVWPVGTLEPNAWGLFDMLGNASEMCFDVSDDYGKEQPRVLDDTPTATPVVRGRLRIVRGGSFSRKQDLLRSGRRADGGDPFSRLATMGFRPARTYR
jgi:eukaryotic-like serine/threonine-protein kinase